jgi:hypothetical protein
MRKHLTYANVVSTICLFLLLGGVAYAGTQLSKGSVGTNALKAEAVTKAKVHANAVNSKKVVNNSLTGSDIQAGTLGKVPNATKAETAERAKSAETATNASHATSADTAANAEMLDGHSPGEFGSVLIATPGVTGTLEAEMYFSVSGSAIGSATLKGHSTILPSRRFRATDFAVHFEGTVQAGLNIHVSLVVNETAQEVCTVTAVPSDCTPTSSAIEIPVGAQVAWKIAGAESVAAAPQFALRLGPA